MAEAAQAAEDQLAPMARYYFSLTAEEKSFLRNIGEDLRTNRRELTARQDDWLNGLYARKVGRQRR
jgi:hypothetical protein